MLKILLNAFCLKLAIVNLAKYFYFTALHSNRYQREVAQGNQRIHLVVAQLV